ncbi:gfo/Idh/MocA family oxidoreductase [Rubrobacter tropicus]|uniref:Gfo/Idh/MocA family oxidoreductase n=1 Tax=Rubrobacter tropicus TaxID=2653851 RepID=A0A6G8Q504_9ACTN|nr:Gfo/Idh/MocA family oxidoreductase [Rubrobacter tropicus]QIN81546.1 gfo/Idh/MocA family oxidoreductase [Rubrobacter tropicus]
MAEFGVGIVGAGTIGAVHARAIGEIEEARLVAVAEPREEAGRTLAGENGAGWHADAGALLGRDDVDVVVLCTPSGMHPDAAVAAAEAGKHVITEKPMAVTLEGLDRMIWATREAGVTLSVIFQYRFNREALRLKRALDAGLFGRPVLGNALVHWHRNQAYYDEKGGWRGTWDLDGGGALMNQSVHAVDLLQWLLGPVESLCAYADTLTHDIETEDVASAALRFTSGALGAIQGTTSTHADYPLKVEIRGTEGGATFERSRLTDWRPAREEEVLSAGELAAFPDAPEEPFGAAHERQLRAIFSALREGTEPPIPGEEARKAVEIILGIYRAASEGERVSLDPALDARKEA